MLLRPLRWLALCVLALSLPLGLTLGSQAQQPESGGPPPQGGRPGGRPSPAQELARLDHALTLTDAQKTAVLPILTKRQTDMEALVANSADREAGREQMRTLMEASRAQIRALLTEPQQKIFDTLRPGRGPRGGGPGGPGENGPPPPPEGSAPPSLL